MDYFLLRVKKRWERRSNLVSLVRRKREYFVLLIKTMLVLY